MRKSRIFILSYFLLFFTSCQDEGITLTPEDNAVAEILTDIYIAHGAIKSIPKDAFRDSLLGTYFDQIYLLHQVDSAWFNEQIQRIESNPRLLDSVHTRVMYNLDKIDKSK